MVGQYCKNIFMALMMTMAATMISPTIGQAAVASSLEMRVLPGDSYASLAAAIYPDNRSMQQRFINETRTLNRTQWGDRGANEIFDNGTSIRIPDLRALSWGTTGSDSTRAARETPEDRYNKREKKLAGLNSRLAELEAQAARVQALLSENMPPVEGLAEQSSNTSSAAKNVEEANGKPLKRVVAPEMGLKGDSNLMMWGLIGLGGLLLVGLLAYFWPRIKLLRMRNEREPAEDTVATPVYESPFSESALAESEQLIAPEPDAPALEIQSVAIEDNHMAVDEIDSVVDEARVIVAMGRTANAIRLLVDHLQHNPRSSVAAWMFLLELYRQTDNRKEFAEAGRRMHEHYNVMIPAWDTTEVSKTVPQHLEAFPGVMRHISETWGSAECLEYLQQLVHDNREGERIGFSSNVLEEILLLQDILIHQDD